MVNARHGSRQPRFAATLPAARFRGRHRAHFLLCVALPMAGVIALPIIAPWLLAWNGALIWLAMWTIVGGLGVSVGLHRHFAHRSFKAHGWVRVMLAICGQMAAQGTVIYWVALHRAHHAHGDQPGDPHSPNLARHGGAHSLYAFVHGHMLWAWRHDVPLPSRYCPDLLRDPLIRRVERHYIACIAAGLLLPAGLGWLTAGGAAGAMHGLFWGGIVRIALGHHLIWSVNSVCHRYGSRPNRQTDRSANNVWLALATFGESWHNNHHAAPVSARLGWQPWQIDIGWWMIALMRRLGAISLVRLR